jgi:hypothetical protein
MGRPPDRQILEELELIEQLVGRHPQGISRVAIEQLLRKGERSLESRTVRRRLARLVEENRVLVTGAARGTVYQPAQGSPESLAPERRDEPRTEEHLEVSRTAEQIRALLRRPLSARTPVGYKREFLEAYQPGRSWYLPESLRSRLHLVGRAQSGQTPAGTYARQILAHLLIDLSWGSSRLEGNTYTRLDTKNLIEFGQRPEGKEATETQMILNHKAAVEFLVENAEEIGFNRYTVLNLHSTLAENLLEDPGEEGALRRRALAIGGSVYSPPDIPPFIEECFDLMLDKASQVPDPFEQAFFIMVHLPYLQPFADVNTRTSRLAANIPFVIANLTPLSFVDVPVRDYTEGVLAVYELQRIDLLREVFVWAYERSSAGYRVLRESMGEPDRIRLRFRSELREVVRDMVVRGSPPQADLIKTWSVAHGIPTEVQAGFAERALNLLLSLHEGSLARYGLRPAEYLAWRKRFRLSPLPGG